MMAGSAAVVVAVLTVGWWWTRQPTVSTGGAALPVVAASLLSAKAGDASATQLATSSGVNASAQPADSFLTDRLQQTFEDMMLEANSSGDITDIVRLKQKLATLVFKYFPADLAARASALLERYVDYRQALGQLAAPTDPGDPSAIRTALQARQRVRQQHFTPEEYEALFGQDARLDQFTVARLDVERQTGLTVDQKRAALETAEKVLSPAQRAQRAESIAYVGVQAQTAAFDTASTNPQDRFAQRSAQYGPEAATRLSQLDAEDRQWRSSLDQYAQAQAEAGLGSKPPTAEQTQTLAQLRQTLFTPEQQARVDAGLELRALNQASPTKAQR